MKQLDHIIEKLKTDRGQDNGRGGQVLFAVSITDSDKDTRIATNMTALDMEASHGTVEEYFNSLYRNGVKNVVIQPRKKNGSAFAANGNPVVISFLSKSEPAMPNTPVPPIDQTPTHPAVPMPHPMGLMGGLSGIDAAYRFMDHPAIKAENERLKEKVEELKEKIAELKEQLLENKYSDSKAAGNKEMLTGIAEILGPIATALITKGAAPAMGLGNPAPSADLSPIKQDMIQYITAQPDTVAQFIFHVLQGVSTNMELYTEIEKLLINHNIIAA